MIATLLIRLIDLYILVIFVYCIMSWVPQMSGWVLDLYEILGKVCDPFLNLFKKVIPPIGMMDISPIAALFALIIIQRLIAIIL